MIEKISTREEYDELANKIKEGSHQLVPADELKVRNMLRDYEHKHVLRPPVLPIATGMRLYILIFPLLFIASAWYFTRDSSPEAVSVMVAFGLLTIICIMFTRWITFTHQYVQVRSLLRNERIAWSDIQGYSANETLSPAALRDEPVGLIFIKLKNGRTLSLNKYLHSNVAQAAAVIMHKVERVEVM